MEEPLARGRLDGLKAAGEVALDPLLDLARRVCGFGAWLGGGIFILSSLMVTVEVIIRKFFALSTGGAEEIPAYGLAIAAAWAFGFALLERAHIRVDSFYLLMPVRVRALLDILAVALFLVFFGLMFYYASVVLLDSVVLGTRSRTGLYIPLVIPQSFWWLGLLLTVVVALLLLVRSLVHLITGDIRALQRLIGTKGMSEEIEEELELLGKRPEREPGGPA